MNIHNFQVNDLGVNCYLLWDTASAEAALIDCGAQTQSEWERIRSFIEQKRLSLKYALLTHCHFDHIMGLPFIHSTYGLKPIFHRMDQPVYDAMPQMAARFGISMPLPLPQAEQYITEGDALTLGTHALTVIHTPGHTWGGVCFHAESADALFSGDFVQLSLCGKANLIQRRVIQLLNDGNGVGGIVGVFLIGGSFRSTASGKQGIDHNQGQNQRNNLFHMLTFLRLYLMAKFMIP